MQHRLLALALLPLLGACAAAVPQPSSVPGPAAPPAGSPSEPPATRPAPPPQAGAFRAPRVMNAPGLEGIIGANAESLERTFGAARLDVREGDARKLQFTGEACVLDVYLYPLRPNAEPTATYVDARRSSDSLDVDRAACVAALRRR
ncbi:hypothetical protein [Pelagerythrobacter rhizovicinus]|uniref:Uncharacterized protein n=1 Tax=Pelagerythrobacter rhizovicinus TaxID=2268576 RepID=A0A4Q2KJR5_9SPHN|nr:hypothetical protein [Pelagerythrobacter rhizovicinus]RXZ64619.1 hypothetical protein ETX26_12095 [Pelagerythrobacter rhizovicinus]